jgi:hypothetical protein
MKAQLKKNGRKWSLYITVLTAMAYSALTLTSEPAYAGTCTAAECADAAATCDAGCELVYFEHGTLLGQCVVGASSYECRCFPTLEVFNVNC